jgi:hypothetical protein
MESAEIFPSLLYEANKQFIKGCLQTEDEVVKSAFIENGLLYSDGFIKEHCACIRQEGDPFEHVWYHFGRPDAKRIISIEKDFRFSLGEENGNYKLRGEKRYY